MLGADTIVTELPRLALGQDHRVRCGVVKASQGARTTDLSAHTAIVADRLGGEEQVLAARCLTLLLGEGGHSTHERAVDHR